MCKHGLCQYASLEGALWQDKSIFVELQEELTVPRVKLHQQTPH